MQTQRKPRIAVIGGGITGAFAGYFLARLGARPTIVEGTGIGAHASGANAGGLNPLHGPGIPGPTQAFALQCLRLHLTHWDEIRRRSQIDFGGRLVPRLHVACDDDTARGLDGAQALHHATAGFSARLLSAAELRRVKPRLGPEAVGALWTEGNARVDPGPYTRAVAAAAVGIGAVTVPATARGLRHDAGRVTAVILDTELLECDGVVIAAGPWSALPAGWLGLKVAVEPLKGELLLAEPERGVPEMEITSGPTGLYAATPGRVWLGGTEDRVGFDSRPTDSGSRRILAAVNRLLPELGPVRIVDHVAGLRPVTPDGFPLIGIPDGWENVCLATGAGRKGMLLGPGLGLAAAELLTRGHTGLDIAACDPHRLVLTP